MRYEVTPRLGSGRRTGSLQPLDCRSVRATLFNYSNPVPALQLLGVGGHNLSYSNRIGQTFRYDPGRKRYLRGYAILGDTLPIAVPCLRGDAWCLYMHTGQQEVVRGHFSGSERGPP
jgi:hypothetical protein